LSFSLADKGICDPFIQYHLNYIELLRCSVKLLTLVTKECLKYKTKNFEIDYYTMQFGRSVLKTVLGAVHDDMSTTCAGRLLQPKLGSNMLAIPKLQNISMIPKG
jgi:hypothetical protein